MPPDQLPGAWDAIVVGAGIAGTMTSLHLARAGLHVLLIEKAAWPRDKACGGCINQAARRALDAAAVMLHDGCTYGRMRLACNGHVAEFPLPQGMAISRRRLDDILVEHAVAAGASFIPGTRASLGQVVPGSRNVQLRQGSHTRTVTGRLVLDCTGLAGDLLPEASWMIERAARIGVGTTIEHAAVDYPAGILHMSCARYGYVGLVQAENGNTNIAAALDPEWCSAMGGPAAAIEGILASAKRPIVAGLRDVHWRGTPQLARQRVCLGAERVLILGDAAGYVEPFTGEGIAWALGDAAAVAPLAIEAVHRWNDGIVERWSEQHAGVVRARQRVCRGVSRMLRHPRLLGSLLPAVHAFPTLAFPLSAWVNRELPVAQRARA